MPFNRNTIGRIIRNLGAAAMRAAGYRIAARLGLPKPKTADDARELALALQDRRKREETNALIDKLKRQQASREQIFDLRAFSDDELPGVISPPPTSTTPGPRTSTMPIPPPRTSTIPGGTYRTQAEPPRHGEEPEYGAEILTPASTNVYSFSYAREGGLKLGTLYVTFKAHSVSNTVKGTTRKGKRESRSQLKGTTGRTVGGKTNERGATYAYYRVPPSVYNRLKAVKDAGGQVGPGVKSPGTGVWEMLRVRGTVWGHKYTYALVQGQVTPEAGGVYIARRATQGGFRTRSIADLGSGQRGFQTSTLPATGGFRTRSAPRN